jgi:hypothetical protein
MNTTIKTVSADTPLKINGERLEFRRILPTFVIEGGVAMVTIGERAFYNCASLAGVILPDAFASTEKSALSGCRRSRVPLPPPTPPSFSPIPRCQGRRGAGNSFGARIR